MAGNVFHVEFGFNETELTSLLEDKRFREADCIIRETAHTSYLDEGCYQRTPLYIVLCGLNRANKPAVRNFESAKLLVQHGASPNFRVPQTDFGVYINPGATPLELLIEFYILTVTNGKINSNGWNPITHQVIGLNGKSIENEHILQEQILELVFILMSHGADCNVRNEYGQTILHHILLHTCDTEITKILCDGGADLNAKDKYGNTPLIACAMSQIDIMEKAILPNNSALHKVEIMQCLLSYAGVEVDASNRFGQTALFYCMKEGYWDSAALLLQNSCDTTIKGRYTGTWSVRGEKHENVSPLLIMCMSPDVKQYCDNFLMCDANHYPGNLMCNRTLVETGLFNKPDVLEELFNFADLIRLDSNHFRPLTTNLISDMFGSKSLTLKQMCTRQVFHMWIQKYLSKVCENQVSKKSVSVDSQSKNNVIVALPGDMEVSQRREEEDIPDTLEIDLKNLHFENSAINIESDLSTLLVNYYHIVKDINRDNLIDLVHDAQLPEDTLLNFEVELVRLFLMTYFALVVNYGNFKFLFESEDSDSSDENDSDLEYW